MSFAFQHIGNHTIWQLPKTAFLCSRKVPAAQVLKCYDWAITMRDAGRCVLLGAHSQLEKDVLHYLLKGTQPVVVVLARGLKKRLEAALEAEISKGRLLVVTPFPVEVKRVSAITAVLRNRFIVDLADGVVVGHASVAGSLDALLADVVKPVNRL